MRVETRSVRSGEEVDVAAPWRIAGVMGGPAGGRGRPVLWVSALSMAFFSLYLAVGLARYAGGRSGNYDLGIFSQGAANWSRFQVPGSSIRGLDNLLSDHFSPITVFFGLAWRVWSDPRSLIVVQAMMLAGAVGVISHAYCRRVSPVATVCVCVLLGVSKGIVSASVFDVHEVSFGVFFMSLLCYSLLDGRRGLFMASCVALLFVKEDLGLTVIVAAGLWWWRTRDRVSSLFVAGAGVVGLVVAFTAISLLNPNGESPYLHFMPGTGAGGGGGTGGSSLLDLTRWQSLLLFVGTLGLVGLRSGIALLALPTLAWRILSSNPSYWQTHFHYDAILVPVAAFALLEVWVQAGPDGVRRRTLRAASVVCLALVALMGLDRVASWNILSADSYRLSPELRDAQILTRVVPDGAPVAAQQNLGPILLDRLDVHMLATNSNNSVEWVLLTDDDSVLGAPEPAKREWIDAQSKRASVTISRRNNVVLVRLPGRELAQLPRR